MKFFIVLCAIAAVAIADVSELKKLSYDIPSGSVSFSSTPSKAKTARAFISQPTVSYVSQPAVHYQQYVQTPQVQYVQPSVKYVQPSVKYVQPAVKYVQPAVKYIQPVQPQFQYAQPSVKLHSVNPIPIAILKMNQDLQYDGQFTYDYQTENGISAQANGLVKNFGTDDAAQVMSGSYTYTAPDGTPITTNWYADENGFHAEGEHLPTPPPIPAEIARSLEYIRSLPPSKEDLKYQ